MPVETLSRQLSNRNLTFKSAGQSTDSQYKDPLMRWPARGLAYTNELGAAISEVAPRLGTLLWFPAMLYFGADIYDKYKNEKDTYNPSAVRGTEQALFQAFASIILPTASVFAGQRLTSIIGKLGKNGLTLQSEEEIINFLQGYMSRRNIADYKDDADGFKASFNKALTNHRKKIKTEIKITNPIRMIKNFIFSRQHPDAVVYSADQNITNFVSKNIDEMFSIYNQLVEDDSKAPKEFSNKMFNQYKKIKAKYLSDETYKDTAKNDAIEMIIKKYQKSKIINAKILKTLGGFAALGLAIKPIDNFVEHTVMKKYVAPRLQALEQARTRYNKQQVKNYRAKIIAED